MNSSVKRGHCSERNELVCVNTVWKRRHRPCRKHHLYSTHLSFFYSVHPSDRPFVQIASSPNIHSGAYGVPNPGLGTGTLSWSWLLQAGRGQNEYTLSTVQGTQAVMREKARGWVEWASRGGLRSREGFWRKHPGGESGGGENKTQEGKTAFAELRGTKAAWSVFTDGTNACAGSSFVADCLDIFGSPFPAQRHPTVIPAPTPDSCSESGHWVVCGWGVQEMPSPLPCLASLKGAGTSR